MFLSTGSRGRSVDAAVSVRNRSSSVNSREKYDARGEASGRERKLLDGDRAQLELERAELARQRAQLQRERDAFEQCRRAVPAPVSFPQTPYRGGACGACIPALGTQVQMLAQPCFGALGAGYHPDGDPSIFLNVGGEVVMAVQRSTLLTFEGSRLAALFKDITASELSRDRQGRIVIDSSADVFVPLINLLRQCRLERNRVPGEWRVPLPRFRDSRLDEKFRKAMQEYGLSKFVRNDYLCDTTELAGTTAPRREQEKMQERQERKLRSPSTDWSKDWKATSLTGQKTKVP